MTANVRGRDSYHEPMAATVLILGSTGFIGARITSHLARTDTTVTVTRRPAAGAGHVNIVLPEWVDEPASVAEAVAEHPIETILVSVGGWSEPGPLARLGVRDLLEYTASHLLPHHAALVIADLLGQRRGRPVHVICINGDASRRVATHSGPVSVMGSALTMLCGVASAEANIDPTLPRVTEVVINGPIAEDDRNESADAHVTTERILLAVDHVHRLGADAPASIVLDPQSQP